MNPFSRNPFLFGRIKWLLTLLVFTGPVAAQKEYDLLGKGARAAGMAYAFNAIADDATALSWNPAGIVQLKKPEIALEAVTLSTDYVHEIRGKRDDKTIKTFSYLGFVYPLKIRRNALVFGVSYQNRMNYRSFYTPHKQEGPPVSDYRYKNYLTVNSVSLCAAWSVRPFLGIGFAVNKWFSLGNKADDYYYFHTQLIDSTYAFDHYYETIRETFAYSGTNFTGGILLDLISFRVPFRLAVRYDSPFTLKDQYTIEGEVKYAYEGDIDTIIIETSRGMERYAFPGILGLGMSYRFGNYLTLACDLDIKPFKNRDYTFDYGWDRNYYTGGQDPPALDLTVQYNDRYKLLKNNANLHQLRIGAEYILHPRIGLIPLRAGWKNNPTSISTYNASGNREAQVKAHSVNAGTGFITRRFSIDLAYERYAFERKEMNYWNEKTVYHFLTVSLNYYIR